MPFQSIHFTLVILAICVSNVTSLSCLDQNQKFIDWFTAYKLPKIENHSNYNIRNGLGFLYLTSDSKTWTLSENPINDTGSIIGSTLNQYYKEKDTFSILYNDQPPEGSSVEKGHNKGVVLADCQGGFWLIHSVPHFPPKDSYNYPKSGTHFGQSFLCISMDLRNLDKVGTQLQYNEPEIYSRNILKALQPQLENLSQAAFNITVKSAPWYKKTNLESKKGTVFISFAKSKQFGKDLYADWVAPALSANLFVETWPDGPGKMPSDCRKPFKVYNVNDIRMDNDVFFKRTHDHSKWAVSQDKSFVCIGDINRMDHQKERGGGTVCIKDKILAGNYYNIISSIENCTVY